MNQIHQAAELIRRRGHVKGSYQTDKGFCAVGALNFVGVREIVSSGQQSHDGDVVADVIREQYPDRVNLPCRTGFAAIVRFNDHEDTTQDEVVAVLEKAAIKLDERA